MQNIIRSSHLCRTECQGEESAADELKTMVKERRKFSTLAPTDEKGLPCTYDK